MSLSLATPPEFRSDKTLVNFGAGGQDDDSVFAVIWNPAD